MGKVYAAEHVLMKKRLAVKVLHRELTLVEVVARFEREAMAASEHRPPQRRGATDGRLSDGSVFLVLGVPAGAQLARGDCGRPDVGRALAEHRPADRERPARRAQPRHRCRDLDPERDVGRSARRSDFVKVLDFGVAKVPIGEVPAVTGTPISRAGMVFGTPEYMAPEQALGEPVDGRADLYALGVMLFGNARRRSAVPERRARSASWASSCRRRRRCSQSAWTGVVPPVVERAVHRLLARDKDRRPASAREVEDTISSLLVPSPSGSTTNSRSRSARRSRANSTASSTGSAAGRRRGRARGVRCRASARARGVADGAARQRVRVAAAARSGPSRSPADRAPRLAAWWRRARWLRSGCSASGSCSCCRRGGDRRSVGRCFRVQQVEGTANRPSASASPATPAEVRRFRRCRRRAWRRLSSARLEHRQAPRRGCVGGVGARRKSSRTTPPPWRSSSAR